MRRVVICEKPKQAEAVRAALAGAFGEVLAAQGHILRLKEPHELRPEWKEWGMDVLAPPAGSFFPTVTAGGKEAIFERIQKAVAAADEVVIATDCDREGELIGREIIDACGYRGPLKRAIYTALDEASIQAAFKSLRPASDFDRLYDAARARASLDQAQNLTMTRVLTVGFKPGHWKGPLGVGRVKTPLLGLIARREIEIQEFKERKFYELCLDVMKPDQSAGVSLWWRASAEDRLWDKAKADAIAAAAEKWSGSLRVLKERKKTAPPRLPHLTELQKRAGRWGWSPEKTLEIAQALYDVHKVLTYPRSECRFLSETQIEAAPRLLDALRALAPFSAAPSAPVIRKGKSGHYCSAEVEKLSHDAIVPNANMAGQFAAIFPKLSPDERRLFELVARLWLAAVSPDAEFDQTTIETGSPVQTGGQSYIFKTVGRIQVVAGWRGLFGADEEDEEEESPRLPAISDGEKAVAKRCQAIERKTKKPERFALAELPEVMENVHRFIHDEALRDKLKETKGIGTSATRGAVIQGLLDQRLIIEEKKRVSPTELGMELFKLLEKVVPALVDPGETGRLEADLEAVAHGEKRGLDVLAQGVSRTAALVDLLKGQVGASVLNVKRAPSDKMVAAAKKIAAARNLKLPKETLEDFERCKAFIDLNGSRPSDSMAALARKLALEKHLEIPDEVLTEFEACKAFIDANKGGRPASPAQIEAVKKTAERLGQVAPENALTDFEAASAYLEAHKAPAHPPTEKQIAFAEKIAAEKKKKIPQEAREDSHKLSEWIDKTRGK